MRNLKSDKHIAQWSKNVKAQPSSY